MVASAGQSRGLFAGCHCELLCSNPKSAERVLLTQNRLQPQTIVLIANAQLHKKTVQTCQKHLVEVDDEAEAMDGRDSSGTSGEE